MQEKTVITCLCALWKQSKGEPELGQVWRAAQYRWGGGRHSGGWGHAGRGWWQAEAASGVPECWTQLGSWSPGDGVSFSFPPFPQERFSLLPASGKSGEPDRPCDRCSSACVYGGKRVGALRPGPCLHPSRDLPSLVVINMKKIYLQPGSLLRRRAPWLVQARCLP